MNNPIKDIKIHPVLNHRIFRGGNVERYATGLRIYERSNTYQNFKRDIPVGGFRICRSII